MGAITSNLNRAHRHMTRRIENTRSLLAGYVEWWILRSLILRSVVAILQYCFQCFVIMVMAHHWLKLYVRQCHKDLFHLFVHGKL